MRLAKWEKKETREGVELTLSPNPVIKTVTYDVFDKGLTLLGVDTDKVLAGKIALSSYVELPRENIDTFFFVVLENYQAFRNWRDWPPDVAAVAAEMIAANFIVASRESFVLSAPTSLRRKLGLAIIRGIVKARTRKPRQ